MTFNKGERITLCHKVLDIEGKRSDSLHLLHGWSTIISHSCGPGTHEEVGAYF